MTPPSRSNNDVGVTNSDPFQMLGRIEEKVDTVTVLAKHTNGRVTKLEQKQLEQEAAQRAIEKYKLEQPVIQHADAVTVKQPGFFDNPRAAGLITALIAVMLALAGYLTFLARGSG